MKCSESVRRKNIVGVFKSDDTQGQNRHKGYVKALQEAGIAYDPDKVVWFYTEDRKVHPYESIRRMVSEGCLMDGIVCYNDQIAMKVIQALNDEKLKVPDDVSVTGYDNSYMATSSGMRLTTIVHPQEKLGEMAAELLLKLIQSQEEYKEEKDEHIEHRSHKSCGRKFGCSIMSHHGRVGKLLYNDSKLSDNEGDTQPDDGKKVRGIHFLFRE